MGHLYYQYIDETEGESICLEKFYHFLFSQKNLNWIHKRHIHKCVEHYCKFGIVDMGKSDSLLRYSGSFICRHSYVQILSLQFTNVKISMVFEKVLGKDKSNLYSIKTLLANVKIQDLSKKIYEYKTKSNEKYEVIPDKPTGKKSEPLYESTSKTNQKYAANKPPNLPPRNKT